METENFIQYKRDGYGFRNYFITDYDESGVDVYIIDSKGDYHFEAEVPNVSIDTIEEMTDAEFENFKIEYGIF